MSTRSHVSRRARWVSLRWVRREKHGGELSLQKACLGWKESNLNQEKIQVVESCFQQNLWFRFWIRLGMAFEDTLLLFFPIMATYFGKLGCLQNERTLFSWGYGSGNWFDELSKTSDWKPRMFETLQWGGGQEKHLFCKIARWSNLFWVVFSNWVVATQGLKIWANYDLKRCH